MNVILGCCRSVSAWPGHTWEDNYISCRETFMAGQQLAVYNKHAKSKGRAKYHTIENDTTTPQLSCIWMTISSEHRATAPKKHWHVGKREKESQCQSRTSEPGMVKIVAATINIGHDNAAKFQNWQVKITCQNLENIDQDSNSIKIGPGCSHKNRQTL